MSININEVSIPDSAIAKAVTDVVRDTESDLLFNHSSRVYFWAALAAKHKNIAVDHELLYVGCMFHDMGLTKRYCSCDKRFEVDGANAAADFLRSYHVSQNDIDKVWTGIALHTTPGIPEFMAPEIAFITAGVEMDVLGINFDAYQEEIRESVVKKYPRSQNFKEDIIQAFYDGIEFKSQTTFGNVKADVVADKVAGFERLNFCSIIRNSKWPA